MKAAVNNACENHGGTTSPSACVVCEEPGKSRYPREPTTVSVDLDAGTVQRLVMLGMLTQTQNGAIVPTPRGNAWMRKLFVRVTRPA